MVAFSLHCCVISFFSNTLEGLGFDINHYDRCVENKIIEDKNKLLPGMWRTKNYHIKHRSNIRQIEQIQKKIWIPF